MQLGLRATVVCALAWGCSVPSLLLAEATPPAPTPEVEAYLLGQPDKPQPERSFPSPAAFLGFSPYERHATFAEVERYLSALAAGVDRLQPAEPLARSHGGRNVLQYVLTLAPEAAVQALQQTGDADSRTGEDLPVVLLLNYGIHGNESSATHAALWLAWHLATTQDPEVLAQLREVVIVLNPCMNPDGFDRFSHWVNRHRGRHPSPHAPDLEHQERFQNGRTNYYGFDLNRDYFAVTQPETRGWVRAFHRWRPHIVIDVHEMGAASSYFFQPGVPERTHPLIPPENQAMTAALSAYFGRALDALGQPYFSRERFDDFYLGKASTYPDFWGSIGVLFEQGSARGQVHETPWGERNFAEAVRNQLATSLAALKGAAALAPQLRAYRADFLEAAQAAGPVAITLWAPAASPVARDIVPVLEAHGLKTQLESPAEHAGLLQLDVTAPAGSERFLQALLEDRVTFPSNVFYDVSAWSLARAYGWWPSPDPLQVEMQAQGPSAGSTAGAAEGAGGPLLGYLLGPEAVATAPGLFAALWREDFELWRLRSGGTWWLPLPKEADRQRELGAVLSASADLQPQRVRRFARDGVVPDLGSGQWVRVEAPRPLLVVGPGIDPYTAGELWHYADTVLELPLTRVDSFRLAEVRLEDFSPIVLPSGRKGLPFLDPDLSSRLHAYVRQGGVLVGMGEGSRWLAQQGWTGLQVVPSAAQVVESAEGPTAAEASPHKRWADRRDEQAAQRLRGIILEAEVDATHPFASGLAPGPLAVLHRDDFFLKPVQDPYETPLRYTADPLLGGYLPGARADEASGAAALVARRIEAGTVVAFGFRPLFRGYWKGTEALMGNLLLSGGLLGEPR